VAAKISIEQKSAADHEIRERQQEVKFDTKDFTVEHIIGSYAKDLFFVPDYQRQQVWTPDKKARFIESVVLGLPIPMMFLAHVQDGRLEIVDGVQRITTLASFSQGGFKLKSLDRLPALNGFKFGDLPVAQQRKLMARALRIVVLDEATTNATRQDIFNRVNTSGDRARPAEVRRGAYQGRLMAFLKERSEDPIFREICPVSKSLLKRQEPLELVLRFFALSERYMLFKHDVAKFLDEFVIDHQDAFDEQRYRAEFDRTMNWVKRFIPSGFAKTQSAKTTPRVRFEAIAVGVNLALKQDPALKGRDLKWLNNPDFLKHVTTHASNSAPRMRGRIEFVRDAVLRGR
jgi:hypothetical protein